MDSHQPSLPQRINPASLATQPRRTWKVGQRAAQAALVFLLCVGGFLSLFPSGRALTRGVFLLPALLSASETAPLVLAGDAVRFTRLTLSLNTFHTVYLDIYEPTTLPRCATGNVTRGCLPDEGHVPGMTPPKERSPTT